MVYGKLVMLLGSSNKNNFMAIKKKKFSAKKGMMSSNFFVSVALAALLVLAVIVLLLKVKIDNYSRQTLDFLMESNQAPDVSIPQADPLIVGETALEKKMSEEKSFGLNEALIKIYYFSDYDCSFCQKQDAILQKLLRKYSQDLRVVVKDYPDHGEGSKTFSLALGGFCAFQQNKYWEYKSLVWRNFDKYEEAGDLLWYVSRQLSLAEADFNQCLKDEKTSKIVKNDLKDAIDSGAFLVPFLRLNDKEFLGEVSEAELEKEILRILDNK